MSVHGVSVPMSIGPLVDRTLTNFSRGESVSKVFDKPWRGFLRVLKPLHHCTTFVQCQ